MKFWKPEYHRFLLYPILLVGIGLRIVVYLQNRSLFLDEANVSLDIVNKSYLDLFRPFESGQLIPPLFASCIKFCTECFGNNEFALRLFPLIISMVSLALFYHTSKKVIEDKVSLIFVNWLFASSGLLIKYATEVKQYGFDVLMTIILISAALEIDEKPFSKKDCLLWISLGMILIWFSMPTIFILSGIGFYMLFKKQSIIQSSFKNIFPILLIGASWLSSFGLYYFSILYKGLSTDSLLSYHQEYFLPFIPTDISSLNQWLFIQHEILRTTIGVTGLAIGSGVLFLFIGIFVSFKKDWKKAILFTSPIIITWIVSSLGKYSMLPRLALFYLPLSILIIGIGIEAISSKAKQFYKYPLILLLIIVASHQTAYKYFWKSFHYEEIKPVLDFLKVSSTLEDIIYVHWEGAPAYEFYTRKHDDKDSRFKIVSHKTILTQWDSNHPELKEPIPQNIWLVFSHSNATTKSKVLDKFSPMYKEIKDMQSLRASCIYLEKKE